MNVSKILAVKTLAELRGMLKILAAKNDDVDIVANINEISEQLNNVEDNLVELNMDDIYTIENKVLNIISEKLKEV